MAKTYRHNGGNKEYMAAMQELRRSNASGTHKSKKAYKRKPKHKAVWT